MCSPELPDFVSSVNAWFPDEPDLVGWLVNVGEDRTVAEEFIQEAGTDWPVLLDRWEAVYGQYSRGDQFAPYPIHVVIDRQGTVVYLNRRYDAPALQQAIQEALAAR